MAMMPPAVLQWLGNEPSVRLRAEQAGEEMTARLELYAANVGQPFSQFESWVLRHSIFDFMEAVEAFEQSHTQLEADAYTESMERGVSGTVRNGIVLVRQAIVADKQMGVQTIKVRSGLRLPVWWEDRYELVFQTGLLWMISPILQSAFLGAPELGETRPWRSP